jgi:hypothetical protein
MIPCLTVSCVSGGSNGSFGFSVMMPLSEFYRNQGTYASWLSGCTEIMKLTLPAKWHHLPPFNNRFKIGLQYCAHSPGADPNP